MPHPRTLLTRLYDHINTHPAYNNYAIYSAGLLVVLWALYQVPWTWVGFET